MIVILSAVLGFAAFAGCLSEILGDIFGMVMLLSPAAGSFRRLHHPKPAKMHGQHQHQFLTADNPPPVMGNPVHGQFTEP